MIFTNPLKKATFINRYKRFLVDVKLPDNKTLTVHCPNSGSMKTCLGPDWDVIISDSQNPKRKLLYTLEMVHNGKCWIGINTFLSNRIVSEAIEKQIIPELAGFASLRNEVPYGKNSRIDILLENDSEKCYVEVKNVTLLDEKGYYSFPDAKTVRGLKHLVELTEMVRQGHRAFMFYLVQRSDGSGFRPARDMDPEYARGLLEAQNAGVEILVYRADVSPRGISIVEPVTPIEI